MCDRIARSLTPGGRFVTVNTNPALDLTAAPHLRIRDHLGRTVAPDTTTARPVFSISIRLSRACRPTKLVTPGKK